jgi:Rrf2 family iron-sulfur cluster assembly transcriptional regulator
MKLSTKGRHAVTAMMELALRDPQGRVTLAAVAANQGISVSYLEQLFARLRRHGLVAGSRGPGGGYRLARPMEAISVAEVILAVDDTGGAALGSDQRCLTHELWQDLSGRIEAFLDGITLADLAERPGVKASVVGY